MVVLAKELIKELKARCTLCNIRFRCCIQNFDMYNYALYDYGPCFWLVTNQAFFPIFLARFQKYCISYKTKHIKQQIISINRFFFSFLYQVQKVFYQSNTPGFLPYFLIEFRRFFYQLIYTVFSSVSHQVQEVFSPINKVMILNTYILIGACIPEKSNCNIMKLHNQLHNKSNPIKIVSYHNSCQS